MRESRVETHLVRSAKRQGWKIRKVSWPGRRGAPDRLLMRPGSKPWLVETKSPRGALRVRQQREIAELRACGFQVVVLNSIELIDAWMQPSIPEWL